MAVRTKDQLLALYGSLGTIFADNTTRAISEEDMRNFGQDLADSLSFAADIYFRGPFDASVTDVYPSTGGSGTGGAVMAGDEWYVSVVGDNTDYGGTMPLKTTLKALVNSPGQTASNWKIS